MSRNLIACGRGHISDDGHASARLERQRGGVVLQQHAGMFRDRSGDIMVRLRDIVRQQIVAADADELGRRRDFGDFRGTLVDVRLGERARFDRASSSRTEVKPGDGISSEPPALTAATAELEPPQSETTMPSKPHSSRRISCSRCLFSWA